MQTPVYTRKLILFYMGVIGVEIFAFTIAQYRSQQYNFAIC